MDGNVFFPRALAGIANSWWSAATGWDLLGVCPSRKEYVRAWAAEFALVRTTRPAAHWNESGTERVDVFRPDFAHPN